MAAGAAAELRGGGFPVNGAAEPKRYEFVSASAEETMAVGRAMLDLLAPPRFIVLRGDLGAGKTTLVKGIVEALGAATADEVTSPTFTLIHEYAGRRAGQPVLLYHLDLYRIEEERDLDALGLDELITSDAITLVEWGEKFPSVTRRSDGEIALTATAEGARKIVVALSG